MLPLSDDRSRRVDEERRLQRVIGHRLALARADTGLTQPQAAERVGRPKSWLSDVELGRRGIGLSEIRRLLEVYATETPGRAPSFEEVTSPVLGPDEEWVARGEKSAKRGNPTWRDRAP